MKILNIKLKNFLCYSGDQNEIQFQDGLNLILGGNGYGKTKLYDAFYWVFLDGITNEDGKLSWTSIVKGSLVSKRAINETAVGKVECSVAIEVRVARGDVFIIERKYVVHKNEDGSIYEPEKSTIELRQKDLFEYRPVSLPDDDGFYDFLRERIIPTDLLMHIWFQGERGIKRAIDTSNSKSLSSVINKLSYIEIWNKYIEAAQDSHRRTKTTFEQAVKKTQKQRHISAKYQKEIKELEVKIDAKEKQLLTVKEELDKVDNQIDDIALGAGVQENIKKFKNEEDAIKSKLEKIASELDETLDKADRSLFEHYWVIYGTDHASGNFEKLYKNYVYAKQDDLKAAEKEMPKMPLGIPTKAHLRQMLEDEHCHICNRPAPKNSEEYHHIKKLLPENYPSAQENFIPYGHEQSIEKLYKAQSALMLRFDSFKDNFQKSKERYFTLEDQRQELVKEVKKTEEQKVILISSLGLESIESGVRMGERIRSLTEISTKKAQQKGSLELEIGQLEGKKKELEENLKKLVKDEIDPVLQKQISYFESLVIATEDAKESQYQQLIGLLETEANRHYENINIQSGAFYGKIKFHPVVSGGYSPRIHNENDEDVTANINTSQILAMQFSILFAILSANKKKGLNKRYPLIADAPNSAFDPKKKKFLLRQLGTTFDQSIVMMFEYLQDDPQRSNRYKVDENEMNELCKEMEENGVNVNVILLDIPDQVNPKDLNELSINIKQL